MNRIGFLLRPFVCVALLSAVAVLAQQQPAAEMKAPVPPAILTAKTIFVSNAGSDSGLFPSPFSGNTDRSYNQFYAALKATGQFELVADPGEADMVLELQLIAPNGPSEGSKQKGASEPLPMFRLVVYDRKTRYALWTLTRSIQIAYLQKTHDRNFDSALSALLLDFETLTSKAPTAAH